MASPIIYGPNYSTYVRTARLALTRQPDPQSLPELALSPAADKRTHFPKRNRSGRVPAFEHDGLKLFVPAERIGLQKIGLLVGALHKGDFGQLIGSGLLGQGKARRADI